MGLLWCYNELQLNFDKCKLCFFPYTVNLPWNYIITIFLRIYVSKKKFNCQKHTEHVFDFSKVMVWISWVFFFLSTKWRQAHWISWPQKVKEVFVILFIFSFFHALINDLLLWTRRKVIQERRILLPKGIEEIPCFEILVFKELEELKE